MSYARTRIIRMKYFFSSPSGPEKMLMEEGAKNFLLSFAVDANQTHKFIADDHSLIIDSGAFTVWNKNGGMIDIEKYRDFCLKLPQEYTFINLDVIPKTGSGVKEIEMCAQQGYENYLLLTKYIKNIMPVYHYGDDIKWLHKYVEHSDYIGISPANDTHEKVKRAFLRSVFKVIDPAKTKTHGLGYSSLSGLALFPFYSIDSISYKRTRVLIGGVWKSFFCDNKMMYLWRLEVRKRIMYQEYLKHLWSTRGINYGTDKHQIDKVETLQNGLCGRCKYEGFKTKLNFAPSAEASSSQ